ncbi:DUF4062 domain-containing protein [Pedobacter cryotolerans]|uniref:DUF4062 domain-containing protein n=1 Tax=Pedobacter cryotolerans TaxID=2571270 RepID=A0A4U1BX81_9SPHI|nr:DUF4062 domain-containing protein [Pedobacter cryotolerans]TKB97298.1 DUF4062 domain-containing protein [Pedobacter cryotolerans]
MAKPRVFLSSTFFDLQQVRADIERFIKEQGFEAVLNEQGNIPYGKETKLEDYCYNEINNVDILVAIIGGRFGSASKTSPDSISQTELKTAYELNKQVYIFIDKGVYSEYRFYLSNKGNENINYTYADNIKIHEFIEFVEGLPHNNTIHPFETSMDIVNFLKEQWAGLFQRFLQEQTRVKEINIIKGVEDTAKTLNQLVKFLTEEKRDKDNAINEILLSGHPAMLEVKSLLKIPFRVYFTSWEELDSLLRAFGYRAEEDPLPFEEDFNWYSEKYNVKTTLSVKSHLFVDNKLRVLTKDEWKSDYISLHIFSAVGEEDDLPF